MLLVSRPITEEKPPSKFGVCAIVRRKWVCFLWVMDSYRTHLVVRSKLLWGPVEKGSDVANRLVVLKEGGHQCESKC